MNPKLRLPVLLMSVATLLLTACGQQGDGSEREELKRPADLTLQDAPVRAQFDAAHARVEARGQSQESLAQAWGELGMLYHAYRYLGPAFTAYYRASQLAPDDPDWIGEFNMSIRPYSSNADGHHAAAEADALATELAALLRMAEGVDELRMSAPRGKQQVLLGAER